MTDPIAKFIAWLDEAKACKDIIEPTAMTLATADKAGQPSARIVLLKAVDAQGFVFYTNLESHKSEEIKNNARVALCFHWPPLFRQVRVEGMAEAVSAKEADAYFSTRFRDSQIGAWASKQSRPLKNREELEQAFAATAKKFEGKDVPRPPYWSGWRVVPRRIEFWQEGAHRLHDRELYTRQGQGWKITRLYP